MTDRRHGIPLRPGGEGWQSWPSFAGLAASLAIVGATVLLAHGARGILPAASLMLFFLVAVLISSVRFGFWTGIAASMFAFLAYNFFFVEPLFTLQVAHAEDVLALCVLLFAAGITGLLAGRMREEADAAKARAMMLEQLSTFAADLGSSDNPEAIESIIVRHLAAVTDGAAVLLKPDGEHLTARYSVPSRLELDWADHQAAERARRRGIREQGTAPGWSGSQFTFHPLAKDGAVIGFQPGKLHTRGLDNREQVAEAVVQQGLVALERARFASEAALARATAERESLRSALLSSLSHDLKTPLATIIGAVTSLRQLGDVLQEEARSDLLLAIEEEAERLSRYVSNLLHMTRLRTGLDLRLDWIDVVDVAHGATERARRAYPGRVMILKALGDMPLIRADAILLEQALFNIVDNAAKFSPADAVEILLACDGDGLGIAVSDKGQGIEEADLAHVFEPFFRGSKTAAAGTGLGLAISRGIVQALGGTIWAESPGVAGTGTTIRIRLALENGSAA
jgi:two-component system sensor histidine kinase KdpD